MDPGVIAAVVAVLAVGAGTVLARRRGASPQDSAAPLPSAPTKEETPTEEGALLVPLPNKRNEALVLGSSDQLAALEAAGLIRETEGPAAGPLPGTLRSALAVGGGEATRRVQAGIDAGRIVALSEQTMEHLKHNPAARDQAGNVLSLVRGKDGRMAHVMRLDKAGAKAAMASNAATLAMTAAVSQQLAHIEQQLTEIRETLDEMRGDMQIEKLSDAVSANRELERIARNVERREYMTSEDRNDLGALSPDVAQNVVEAEMNALRLLQGTNADLSRGDRVDQMKKLMDDQRLEFWLALRVETELAYTRRNLLELYWEQSHEPAALGSKADEVRCSIYEREERMKHLGEALRELSDPEKRRWLDPFQQIARRRLERADNQLEEILAKHGQVFAGPENDPYAIVDSGAEEVLVLNPAQPDVAQKGAGDTASG